MGRIGRERSLQNYCIGCGEETERGHLFCPKCGKPVNQKDNAAVVNRTDSALNRILRSGNTNLLHLALIVLQISAMGIALFLPLVYNSGYGRYDFIAFDQYGKFNFKFLGILFLTVCVILFVRGLTRGNWKLTIIGELIAYFLYRSSAVQLTLKEFRGSLVKNSEYVTPTIAIFIICLLLAIYCDARRKQQ